MNDKGRYHSFRRALAQRGEGHPNAQTSPKPTSGQMGYLVYICRHATGHNRTCQISWKRRLRDDKAVDRSGNGYNNGRRANRQITWMSILESLTISVTNGRLMSQL